MKKFILLFCFLMISSLSYSQMDQIFLETFNYTPGSLLTANGWSAFNGGGTNPITVVSPPLSYPGYDYSNVGNSARLVLSGEDDSKRFDTTRATDTLYATFLVKVDTARISAGAGDSFFLLMDTTSNTSFWGRVWIKDSSLAGTGKYSFGISKNATGTAVLYSPASYSIGTTYLVVLKYRFVPGTSNDEVSLFVFSSGVPAMEPPTATLGPHIGTINSDPGLLGRVALRQGASATASNLKISGISVTYSWEGALPVELTSFTSSVNGNNVNLNWSTASELNNSGFDIERASNGVWTKVGNVEGNGNSTSTKNYSFTDRNVASGKYNYRLKQIDFNGHFEYFNLSNEVNVGVPERYELSQNYPNPFNPSTSINFSLPVDSKVSLKIYDMSGKEVATVINEAMTAGYHSVNFNASSLSSGVYFYSISAGNFTAAKKMMLIK